MRLNDDIALLMEGYLNSENELFSIPILHMSTALQWDGDSVLNDRYSFYYVDLISGMKAKLKKEIDEHRVPCWYCWYSVRNKTCSCEVNNA